MNKNPSPDSLKVSDPKTKKLCRCGSTKFERVRRSGFEKMFTFWLPVKKFKCHYCSRFKWVLNNGAS